MVIGMKQKERGDDAVSSSFYRPDDSDIDKHLCHSSCRHFDDTAASPLSWVSKGCILIGMHGDCSAAIRQRAGAQFASAEPVNCKLRFAPRPALTYGRCNPMDGSPRGGRIKGSMAQNGKAVLFVRDVSAAALDSGPGCLMNGSRKTRGLHSLSWP